MNFDVRYCALKDQCFTSSAFKPVDVDD